jgi:hypothetical protein
MILWEWDAPEGHPGSVAYTCMLSYPIDVFHLSLNFLFAVTLVYRIYHLNAHPYPI